MASTRAWSAASRETSDAPRVAVAAELLDHFDGTPWPAELGRGALATPRASQLEENLDSGPQLCAALGPQPVSTMTASNSNALMRFNMSPPPEPGGDKYEENLTNWFLEGAFFRDFVYRNQEGKRRNSELADGLVLFGKTALFVQSKAQAGKKQGADWAAKNIKKALDQIGYGERMLRERLVPEVVSDTLGPISFDPDQYSERIGLVVVRQADTSPYVAADLVPELRQQRYPVHVLSLEDLIEVAVRFDTASDFLFYLEERGLLAAEGIPAQVHREIDMARTMSEFLPGRLRRARPDLADDVLQRSVAAFRRKVSGDLRHSPDWVRSLLVDDVIARMHDRDPQQPWNAGGKPQDAMLAAELLSELDRARRAEIGRKCIDAAVLAAKGEDHWGAFYQGTRFNQCVYVFLFMDKPRQERLELAEKFLRYAMVRCGMPTGLVVATNSIEAGGRAYDVLVRRGQPSEEERALFEDAPNPFNVG